MIRPCYKGGYIRRMTLRSIWLCLIILLAAMAAPMTAHASSADINAASRSVVRVAVFSQESGERKLIGHGSGLAIGSGKIITNAHVVEESIYNEMITFQIIPSQGRESYMATVQKWSPENDLALLKLEAGAKIPAASLYSGSVPDGADVFAIGYPANVDVAMELSAEETLRPQPPVKTRGTVSAGRSAKAYDTILHTAPIAPGHSGGPMVDSCGRVVGINSFGSTAANGGSEFYFAISIKELLAFLRSQKVTAQTVSGPCKTVAELTYEEEKREAAARKKIENEQRVASELKANQMGKIRRDAEFEILSERENRMALSGLLLLLALAALGLSYVLFDHKKRTPAKIAGIACAALIFAAIAIYMGRPSFADVDDRVKTALIDDPAAPEGELSGKEGNKLCMVQLDRSRITVSSTADIKFNWAANGCVNDRTQYAQNGNIWSRSFVPNNDPQVSIVRYDSGQNLYRIERYLLGYNAMKKARSARKTYNVSGCMPGAEAQAKINDMNTAVRAVLPAQPNEVLVFSCQDSGE